MDVAIRPIDDASILNLIESTWPEACDDEDEDEQGDYVCIGDVIPTDEDGFLRGHGTQVVHDSDERRDKLVATLCGVVQRVDRLVYVRPLKSR